MESLNCEINKKEVKSLEPGNLDPALISSGDLNFTVGEEFALVCKGSVTTLFHSEEKLRFKIADKTSDYRLRLLSLDKSGGEQQIGEASSSLVLNVVSYQVGEHQLGQVILTDGINEMTLALPAFTVISVQKQNAPVQEAFPRIFPLSKPLPLESFLSLFFIVIYLFGFILSKFLKKRRLDLFQNQIKRHLPSAGNYFWLQGQFRKMQKEFDFFITGVLNPMESQKLILRIEDIFFQYLENEFLLPVKNKVSKKLYFKNFFEYQVIKQRDKMAWDAMDTILREIKKIFSELDHVKKSASLNVNQRDVQNLLREIQKLADLIEKSKRRVL